MDPKHIYTCTRVYIEYGKWKMNALTSLPLDGPNHQFLHRVGKPGSGVLLVAVSVVALLAHTELRRSTILHVSRDGQHGDVVGSTASGVVAQPATGDDGERSPGVTLDTSVRRLPFSGGDNTGPREEALTASDALRVVTKCHTRQEIAGDVVDVLVTHVLVVLGGQRSEVRVRRRGISGRGRLEVCGGRRSVDTGARAGYEAWLGGPVELGHMIWATELPAVKTCHPCRTDTHHTH